MNSKESEENTCRICLEDNVELDWNDVLYDSRPLTYKDCYYKYTQLEYFAQDNFLTMLCRNCSNGLEYIDSFISKAIETHLILQESLRINVIIKDDEDGIKREATIFEPMSEETVIDPEIQNVPSEELVTVPAARKMCSRSACSTIPLTERRKHPKRESIKRATKRKKKFCKKLTNILDCKSITEPENSISEVIPTKENMKIEPMHFIDIENFKSSPCTSLKRQHSKRCDVKLLKSSDAKNCSQKGNKYQSLPKISIDENCNDNLLQSATTNNDDHKEKNESFELNVYEKCITESMVPSTIKQAGRAKKKILLCQYCSFKVKGTNQLKKHEATHSENRARTETCPKCGIKLYTKSTLNEHMKIHDENRQKNYKCEFCEKAFFNKGTLNVHKRIHLGLMVKCQICSKEFFRKIELDRHMNSHSATLINVEPKKRSRYLVRCKYCNKKIMSTSFKSHTAAHLNEPLMKCSICNKEFFRRDSCTDHLKYTHKKPAEEYNHFIISYQKNRLSHLYLEQTADLQQD